ncbi:hypothetical protein HPB52_006167 [Rhipicephalus sanguineus]|uniref:Glutaredoxin-related protein 5, mitochondrial n=1 Tax=Rhipicephalus sanguineus TaxID=34632 RepID=A0A9D4QC98_RHISA|nr:hypothetical protein HPB52_006167 [Rhipicephalus sanguineus]
MGGIERQCYLCSVFECPDQALGHILSPYVRQLVSGQMRELNVNRGKPNRDRKHLSKTYYEVLGVKNDCTQKEVRDAYVKLCKQLHPDVKGPATSIKDHSKFTELNQAYTTLSKPLDRKHYDDTLLHPELQNVQHTVWRQTYARYGSSNDMKKKMQEISQKNWADYHQSRQDFKTYGMEGQLERLLNVRREKQEDKDDKSSEDREYRLGLATTVAMLRSPVRLLSTAAPIADKIANLIKQDKVVVFMKGVPEQPRCGFSNAVVQVLRMHGVDYSAHDVLQDEALRQGIKDFSNWPTIPQVYIDGQFVGGCDIVLQLHQSGELVDELAKVGIKSLLVDSGSSTTDEKQEKR